jgi:hypothetical protein
MGDAHVDPSDGYSLVPGAERSPLASHFLFSGSSHRLGRERPRQQIMHDPPMTRHSSCYRRRPVAVTLRLALSTTFDRVGQRLLERLMWPHEVILGPSPLHLEQQLRRRLHRRPGSADEGHHVLPQRQIDPLDKGGIKLASQAQSAEGRLECFARPTAQHVRDTHQRRRRYRFLTCP